MLYVLKNFYNLIIYLTHFLQGGFWERKPIFAVRHRQCVKIHKKQYDKSAYFFTPILFNEIFDEKSYKMDIYKCREKVYNKIPSKEPIRVGALFILHSMCVFCEISS